MPDNTRSTGRWVWPTLCAILFVSVLALGYTLFVAHERLSAAQRELATAKEHAAQTTTLVSEFKSAFANVQSELAEATAALEKERRRTETLQSALESTKTTDSWKLLTERTLALDEATAYRRKIEDDLAKAKSEIERLKGKPSESKANAPN